MSLVDCPFCKGKSKVLDGRKTPANSGRRRRKCKHCGERFSTDERIDWKSVEKRKVAREAT